MRKNVLTLLKITAALAISVTLFYKVGITSIINALLHFDLRFLPFVVVLQPLSIAIGYFGLFFFLRILDTTIPIKTALKLFSLTYVIGSFIPGKFNNFLIPFFAHKKIPFGKTTAIVMLDKLISLVVMLICAALGIFFFFRHETRIIQTIGFLFLAFVGAHQQALEVRPIGTSRWASFLQCSLRHMAYRAFLQEDPFPKKLVFLEIIRGLGGI